MNKVLEVKSLASKSKKRYVYRDINFEACGGEIVGLLGHNGAGKSTMLRKIANIEAQQEGQVIVDGKENKIEVYRKDVVYVPDVIDLIQDYSIAKQLELYRQNYKLNEEFISEYMQKINLNEKDVIASLSKGNQEILQLIILLAIDSKVIVLDEPFSAIDIFRRELILEMILSRINSERVIIITSHLIDEIEPVINRLIYLHEGCIVIDREVESILQENDSLTAYLKSIFKIGGELC